MNTQSVKLQEIRTHYRYSQKEFSALLNMKATAYNMIESGKNGCTAKVLEILFCDLNISPNWFFKNSGEMFNTTRHPQNKAAYGDTEYHKIYDNQMVYNLSAVCVLEAAVERLRAGIAINHGIEYKQVDGLIDGLVKPSVSNTEIRLAFTTYDKHDHLLIVAP